MGTEYNMEADRPLKDTDHDALGVAGLAKRFANSIIHMKADQRLVVGLYGRWGSGKTTFINFVKKHLSTYCFKCKPIILDYNPWLFFSHEDLIQHYIC